jgi:uncharacterized repeat protein (TIGR03803 family)
VDGAEPCAGLVQGIDGNFYGTTYVGGANDNGVVFKISPKGNLTTLYSFCSLASCTDGSNSFAPLVRGSDGNFYGTTADGGATGCCGTVFKITPHGRLTTLYSFCSQSNCPDGGYPFAGLIQGTDGMFYGTTGSGSLDSNYGTVFKISRGGSLTTLYSFCPQTGCDDGAYPFGGVIQATNGVFYGVTSAGGGDSNCSGGCGTVFSLSIGLGPFVKTRPVSGKAGTQVTILGNNLKGTTRVAFDGTKAQFKVISNTGITTSVPTGATTGFVTVTTPNKKLRSNVAFRVTQQ